MSVLLQQRLIKVEEYHRMVEAGIISSDEQVELLAGQIIVMSPSGSRHAATIDKIQETLSKYLIGDAIIRVQSPVTLNEYSEPEPDISVLVRRDDYYVNHHPTPKDILLVIEVADSSIEKDRQLKAEQYAISGIVQYWIVDIENTAIEVYSDLEDGAYTDKKVYTKNQEVELHVMAININTSDLLI